MTKAHKLLELKIKTENIKIKAFSKYYNIL